MGFEQAAEMKPESGLKMRFYRGGAPGHHHDLALAEVADPAAVEASRWSMRGTSLGINHLAVQYPDRESWLRQVEHMLSKGVKFLVRGEHGMSHSVYIQDPNGVGIEVLYDLPEEVWSGNLNEAFNYFKPLPREGEEALQDTTDNPVFS
jgi:catechol 2,3-dioxygenase